MAVIERPELTNGGRGVGRDRPPRRGPSAVGGRGLSLGHREDADGVQTIRGDRGDLAVVFSGRAVFNNLDYLEAVTTDFASRNLRWTPDATRPIINRALDVGRLTGGREITPDVIEMIMEDPRKAAQVPSIYLIRKVTAGPGQYFAETAQRKYYIPTSEGEKGVNFHILRAVDHLFRGHNVGRWMVELLLNKHEADYYVHRSSNPMALDTNRKTPNLRQEGRVPYDKPYYVENDDGSITPTGIEYEIAKAVLALTVGDQYRLDPNGVVKGLYRQPNRAFVPNPKYPDTLELYEQMIKPKAEGGWGMNLAGGDTLMPIYRVK